MIFWMVKMNDFGLTIIIGMINKRRQTKKNHEEEKDDLFAS